MNKKNLLSLILKESEKWIEKGIINEKQADKIRKFYHTQYEETNLTFIKITSIISVLLIVFGSVMFFSGSRDNMNAFSKIFIIFLWLWVFGSTTYLFIKRKDLHAWFVWLRLTSMIFWVLLIVLNQMLDIYLPYYVIFFLWFLCIIPFVMIFRFKYFLIFAIILLYISTFLFVYYYYPNYTLLLTLVSIIIVSISILNIKRVYRVFQTQDQYFAWKSYHNMLYLIWIIWLIISFLIFTQKSILSKIIIELWNIDAGISSYKIFYLLSFLPLAIFLFAIVAYYFRKKIKFENWELTRISKKTKRSFKEQIIDHISKDKWIFAVNIFVILLIFTLLWIWKNNLNLNNLSFLINISFVLINWYFFYEWLYLKVPSITNLSIFWFFTYFIIKYFVFFYWKVNLPILVIWWWVIFMIVWYLVEKNKQIIIRYVAKNIKDWSDLYLK